MLHLYSNPYNSKVEKKNNCFKKYNADGKRKPYKLKSIETGEVYIGQFLNFV